MKLSANRRKESLTMRFKRISVLLIFVLCLLLSLPVLAHAADSEIVILYTNDVHAYMGNHVGEGKEDALTYSKIATLKEREDAILVDAGDHIQGTAYGGMDKGQTIVRLMNQVGYDLATLGNHEFDYGMDGRINVTDHWAEYPYLSCNFYHETDGIPGDLVLDAYRIVEKNGKKIAFVGITTPETLTATTPAYFQNESGQYIYGIAGGEDGSALYAAVQSAVDAAAAEGADYIIALGHLGVDRSASPWTSREVIANTSGLDAFIDGHSHTTIPSETVFAKDGAPVILTQTGSYLQTLGKLTIGKDGTLTSALFTQEALASVSPDPEVKMTEDHWISEIEGQLGKVIGNASVIFDNFDENGSRLVRKQSTNTGDFAADALYHLFSEMDMDVDVAVMNGGGIRNTALTGQLTYLSCKQIHTFGNVACLLTVSGQQLLDALEWCVRELTPDGSVEDGSFLHIAGAKYTVDLTIPSTVQEDEKGVWTGPPTGAYRVKNVVIYDKDSGEYLPLNPKGSYNLAGYNYTLRDLGGGFAMLQDAVNVLDYVAEDYMVLANYIQSFPTDETTGLPTISADSGYDDIRGSGRITILTEQQPEAAITTYVVKPGDSLWRIAKTFYGAGSKWNILYQENSEQIADPSVIRIGQTLVIPAA